MSRALLLVAALAALALASLFFGEARVDLPTALSRTGSADGFILWQIRAPRIFGALLVGAALGAAGAALQGLLRNPLVEPGILGVSPTAAAAATLVAYGGFASADRLAVSGASLAGALAATAALAFVAARRASTATLILTGVALSSLSGALIALLVNLAPDPFSLADLVNWTAGSLANRDWADVLAPGAAIGLGLALLAPLRRPLDMLSLGEEQAFAAGVELARLRARVVAGAGLAAGGAVALAGVVGFVGLIAPHLVRRGRHAAPGSAMLPSAAAGALLLLFADLLIRLFPWGTNELHLGTLSALIGAPLFVLLLWRGAARDE